jgi:hypothetical protein
MVMRESFCMRVGCMTGRVGWLLVCSMVVDVLVQRYGAVWV